MFDTINKAHSFILNAEGHIAARAFAILPALTRKEQHDVYMWGYNLLRQSRGSPPRQPRAPYKFPSGAITFSPEHIALYETNVIKDITTPAAKEAAQKLPRPWPIWEPPIIWGIPSPPLPRGIGISLANDVIDTSGKNCIYYSRPRPISQKARESFQRLAQAEPGRLLSLLAG